MIISNERDVIYQIETYRRKLETWLDIFVNDINRIKDEGITEELDFAVQNSRSEVQKYLSKLNYPIVMYAELYARRKGVDLNEARK